MTRIVRNAVLTHCLLALAGACSSSASDDGDALPPVRPPVAEQDSNTDTTPPAEPSQPSVPNQPNVPIPTSTPDPVADPGPELIIPTDTRAPRIADKPPVPITGGTLIVTADGKYAVAADPDRDRVSVVDITQGQLTQTIALQAGDEPGRLVEDDLGHAHVALRRGGAVASLDLASGAVIDRRAVCAAPRGIAFDASARTLRVACASGELVTLPVESGAVSERLQLDSDLRDVVIANGSVLLTRFKRAELLLLPAGASQVQTRARPASMQTTFPDIKTGALIVDSLEPELAWRTASYGNGGYVMLHQGAREGDIALGTQDELGRAGMGPLPPTQVSVTSPYGGGGGVSVGGSVSGQCGGVVQTELTRTDANGAPVSTVRMDAVLAVDVSVAPISGWVAIVQAGDRDPEQPEATFASIGGSPGQLPTANVVAFDPISLAVSMGNENCVFANAGIHITGQATALAFGGDDTLIVQTREPAAVTIVRSFTSNRGLVLDDAMAPAGSTIADSTRVDLGGDSVYDSGHELFHRDAGARIACASCHAEGGDDGHVWHFTDVGARRTQSVNVGLAGTAPFHWSGDQSSIAALMEDVFVTRMGGVHESAERTAALQDWLFAQTPPPAQRAADDAAALRGKALFDGQAECASCHSGEAFTNNATVDVGTGEALQVPSLRGIGYRAPLIHDGCAAGLIDRFDPACGGAKHGKTAQLSSSQIEDMVAYLQTL